MSDPIQDRLPEENDSKLGLIIVFAFAFGLPIVGMIVSYLTHKPK